LENHFADHFASVNNQGGFSTTTTTTLVPLNM
jgi:hypothetical protein